MPGGSVAEEEITAILPKPAAAFHVVVVVSYVSWVSSASVVRTMSWLATVSQVLVSVYIRLCGTVFPVNCRLERNS